MDQECHNKKLRSKRDQKKKIKPSDQSFQCGIMGRNVKTMTKEKYDSIMNQLNHYKEQNIELKIELKEVNQTIWDNVDMAEKGLKEISEGWKNAYREMMGDKDNVIEGQQQELDRMKNELRQKDALITELNEDRDLFAAELEKALIEKDEAVQAKKKEAIQQQQEKTLKTSNVTQSLTQFLFLHWMNAVYCWIILSIASIADAGYCGITSDIAKDGINENESRTKGKIMPIDKEKDKEKETNGHAAELIFSRKQDEEKSNGKIEEKIYVNNLANYYRADNNFKKEKANDALLVLHGRVAVITAASERIFII